MKGEAEKLVRYMEGSDKRFVIPVYQRNYDWKIENCKQLYDDLKKLSEELQQTMYAISQKAYEQVQKETEAGQASGNAQDTSSTDDKKDEMKEIVYAMRRKHKNIFYRMT